MAWNPNIPTVTNRVQDDLDAIRENFQHLDQLAERADELQTVSELAPIANDLQTVSGLASVVEGLQTVSGLAPVAGELQAVSGLAPVANELQAVSGLAPVANELQAVSELAPYVQALLDSRIVEMGSNSNGTYVRWENGLQVCWVDSIRLTFNTNANLTATWTFPAAFVGLPVVSHHTHGDLPIGAAKRRGIPHTGGRTSTSVILQYYDGTDPFAAGDSVESLPFAIGRWK